MEIVKKVSKEFKNELANGPYIEWNANGSIRESFGVIATKDASYEKVVKIHSLNNIHLDLQRDKYIDMISYFTTDHVR